MLLFHTFVKKGAQQYCIRVESAPSSMLFRYVVLFIKKRRLFQFSNNNSKSFEQFSWHFGDSFVQKCICWNNPHLVLKKNNSDMTLGSLLFEKASGVYMRSWRTYLFVFAVHELILCCGFIFHILYFTLYPASHLVSFYLRHQALYEKSGRSENLKARVIETFTLYSFSQNITWNICHWTLSKQLSYLSKDFSFSN